ncbi:MAG: hypothetical protein IPL86_05680 [Flavobacteriales bacterium]|nr:hypothetical protein [Flavobacteriales bacterium]
MANKHICCFPWITAWTKAAPPSIDWPAISDTLTGKISVLLDSHVDTILPEKAADPYHFRQQRTLTITSWDSGYWAIPPFRFIANGDTLVTDPLLLTVNTVPVDTTKAIRPIKGIYTVPFSFMDWLRDNWPWVAGGLALLAAIVALVIYFKRRKPKEKRSPRPHRRCPRTSSRCANWRNCAGKNSASKAS